MSEQDSFIQEVTEEVERDKLFGYVRRYGWIAILLIILLVGGAAWNEIRKARLTSAAETQGDAILSALDADDAASRNQALAELLEVTPDRSAAVTSLIYAGTAGAGEDANVATAIAELDAVAADSDLALHVRDLAAFKAVLIGAQTLSPDERLSRLASLSAPGGAYRLLALEQTALAQLDAGDTDAAIGTLRDILFDAGVTQGLRQRVSQLIVALGGSLDAT